MIRFSRKSVILSAGVSLFALTPAYAQNADAPGAAADEEDENVIVVSGIRAALDAAARAKRDAAQIKDVISAEDIGKLPDTNVAEALQRVTGVQINRDAGEGSEVAVRGFSQNRVEINGQTQVGSDAAGNVAYNTIPSEAFSSLEVIKTPAADDIEGSLGATIRFNTRMPFDNNGKLILSAKAQAQYADRAGEWTPNASFLFSKGWSVGDGEFGVLVSYTRNRRKLRQDFFEVRGWEAVNGFGLDLDGDGAAGEPIEFNDDRSIITDLQDGAYVPQQTLLRVREQDRRLDSITTALQFRPSTNFEAYFNGTFSSNRARDFQYGSAIRFNSVTRALPDGGFEIRDQYSDIENMVFSPDQTALSAFLGSFRNNGRADGVSFGLNGSSNPQDQEVYTAQWGIKWEATDRLDIEFEYSLGHGDQINDFINTTSSLGNRDRPFFFYDFAAGTDIPTLIPLQQEVDGVQTTTFSEGARFDFSDIDIYSLNNFTNTIQVEENDEDAFRLDFDYRTNWGPITSVEFGARTSKSQGMRSRTRARDAGGDADGTLGDRSFEDVQTILPGSIINFPFDDFLGGATGDYPSDYLNPNPEFLRDNKEEILATYNIVPFVDQSYGYDVKRRDNAAYLKFNLGFDVGNIPVFGNIGVRYIDTKRTASGPVASGTQDDANIVIQTVKYDYNKWLPSMNIIVEPFNKFYLRFGAAKVIARPSLIDVSPLQQISDSFDRGRAGNPFLEPQEVNQVDLSIEKYYGQSNLVSVAFFYKDFKQRIEDGISLQCLPIGQGQPEFSPGDDGCLVGQDLIRLDQPQNVGGATVKGVEIGWQQSLDFLPSPLDGFGFQANYTYVDAGDGSISATGRQLPVQDLSKHSYNLVGYYEKYGLQLRAAYNWRSSFYDERTDTNQASFAEPYGQLDASISYDITKKINISFDALNILNTPEERFQEIRERQLAYRVNDTRYLIGVRVRY